MWQYQGDMILQILVSKVLQDKKAKGALSV